ncbi:TadE/TadG family type IV pilus assembly protein [Erythrobacter sp. THAF29]|uniref:TadE/TadG family type IV pilus assembly protein n=1 Tax=Erythrobacter sp. THAF29 TaxID=2587851 RepID=UPI0012AA5A2E|nr:TadE/TadG family type IV pilus assembly protein [Erythrobacter sp. THAF29]QFT77946.1 TadE-like protein [Erythrobacter sp. THAF29]
MIRMLKGNRTIRSFARDTEGAALTEFGMVAPILCLLVMGIFDLAHTQYTSVLVNGAMQDAGRNLTLESAGSQQSSIDQKVIDQVQNVVPANATVTLEKLSHFDFSDIGEAEEFDDENGDTICNNNEVFVDANGNGTWDANRGSTGIGGARDAVLYTAVVTYPRLFPMYGLAGMDQNVTVRAATVLRNQPYDEQDRSTETGNCP